MEGARPTRATGERGSGLISAWFGLLVFFVVLLAGVQVILNLYANSVVGAAAYDAARVAATTGADDAAIDRAEERGRSLLGHFGDEVSFDWSGSGPDEIVLRVVAEAPGVLPAAIRGPVAFGEIDRTVRVRVERFR